MDLLRHISLSNWTGKNIQSDEPESPLMVLAIFADEGTFHETHVGLKRHRIGEPRTSAGAANAVQPYETFEIRNLRRIVKALQGRSRRQGWEMVDEDAERRIASDNGLRFSSLTSTLGRFCKAAVSTKPNRQYLSRFAETFAEKFRRFHYDWSSGNETREDAWRSFCQGN